MWLSHYTWLTKTKTIPIVCWQVRSHSSSKFSIWPVLFTEARKSLQSRLSYKNIIWILNYKSTGSAWEAIAMSWFSCYYIWYLAFGWVALTTNPMHTKRMPAHLNQASLWKVTQWNYLQARESWSPNQRDERYLRERPEKDLRET